MGRLLIKKWRVYTLERGLGWFEVFLWVVANPVASGFTFFTVQMLGTPGLYGGSNLLAYLLAGLVYVPVVLAFMYVALNVQRAAAPYVLISRAVSPVVAFIAIWYYMAASGGLLSLGFLVYYGFKALAGNVLLAGLASGDQLLVDLGVVLNQPLTELYLGVLVVAALFILASVGTRRLKWVLAPIVVTPLLITLAYTVALYLADPGTIYENWARATGLNPVLLEDVALKGALRGVTPLTPAPLAAATGGMMVAALWAYAGLESASFVAGEVKDPVKSYTRGYPLGFLTVFALYLLVPFVVETKLGVSLVASHSYLYYNYRGVLRSLSGRPLVPPSIFVYLSLFTSDKYLILLAGLAAFMWFLNTAYTIWLAAIRILYALAVDKMAPSSLARVTGVRGVPIVANNVVFSFGIVGLLLGCLTVKGLIPVASLLKLFGFSYSILVWLTGLSLAVLPWTRGGFYEGLPFKRRVFETAVGAACFASGWFMLLYSGSNVSLVEVVANSFIGLLALVSLLLVMRRFWAPEAVTT
ncbi:Amino acid transporter, putative [Thermogladius calderae 1633]|uniref:Amino acid transporter, putative n=1 Tax=Thermogladius calderae (strain DSM 22663 / VKM B-2946 / 1633) TaxID=1184251 RepID=I3TFY5_THEC1|nr:APC family permease [Thermogladius calderae]AFK51673.1 Amino acid transporter, putative [Thermogladius calderae 1633]